MRELYIERIILYILYIRYQVISNRRVTIDEVASSLSISHCSAIKSSTKCWESVHYGYQKCLLQNTKANIWTSASAYWIVSGLLQPFGLYEEAFRGWQFTVNADVHGAVQKWLQDQLKIFLLQGIQKLVACWAKCNVKEDYIEK